jgi:nitrite reductase (NADH) small subunit/3-phenylpropionate/trans-cinnamate dioxygenase ferredoxin subunit
MFLSGILTGRPETMRSADEDRGTLHRNETDGPARQTLHEDGAVIAARARRARRHGVTMGSDATLVKIGSVGEVPAGSGTVVKAGSKLLALFNVDGSYYAIDNGCPHRGGPLGEGDLDGRAVTCPWHAWSWDVTTGANVNNPAVKVACYPVTVRDGAILVDLAARA